MMDVLLASTSDIRRSRDREEAMNETRAPEQNWDGSDSDRVETVDLPQPLTRVGSKRAESKGPRVHVLSALLTK